MYLIKDLRSVTFSGGEAETVAYAAHCQQEAELDRPIAGHTNICPQALNSTKIEVNWGTVHCSGAKNKLDPCSCMVSHPWASGST